MPKRPLLLTCLLTLPLAGVVTPVGARAETWRNMENSHLGCRTADILVEANKQNSPDKYLMGKLKAGDCKLLPAGQVTIEAVSPDAAQPRQSCVKPPGFDKCWWVPDDFLR